MVCVCKAQGNCWLWFVSAKTQGKCCIWFVSAKTQGMCWLWFVSAKHRASVGYGLCLQNTGQVLVIVCACKTQGRPVSVGYGLCMFVGGVGVVVGGWDGWREGGRTGARGECLRSTGNVNQLKCESSFIAANQRQTIAAATLESVNVASCNIPVTCRWDGY